FLMIGVNDIARDTSIDSVAVGIERIIDKIKVDSPRTKIYVQSILPLNEDAEMFLSHTKRYLEIPLLNKTIEKIAHEKCVTYIDVYSSLVIPNTEKLDLQYSNDGLHLLGTGYLKWADILKPYIEE
ncbi:MAG: sialate O-acetylesterase, partial [Proteiniphilum sp.]|nr:sialate O-acetylesterase [Proteiniphilum sp.]